MTQTVFRRNPRSADAIDKQIDLRLGVDRNPRSSNRLFASVLVSPKHSATFEPLFRGLWLGLFLSLIFHILSCVCSLLRFLSLFSCSLRGGVFGGTEAIAIRAYIRFFLCTSVKLATIQCQLRQLFLT